MQNTKTVVNSALAGVLALGVLDFRSRRPRRKRGRKARSVMVSPSRQERFMPHVNAPVADLPVRKIIGGMHFIADLTLPYGRILYDYLLAAEARATEAEKTGTRKYG
jgi:acetoacetate decarboxylase